MSFDWKVIPNFFADDLILTDAEREERDAANLLASEEAADQAAADQQIIDDEEAAAQKIIDDEAAEAARLEAEALQAPIDAQNAIDEQTELDAYINDFALGVFNEIYDITDADEQYQGLISAKVATFITDRDTTLADEQEAKDSIALTNPITGVEDGDEAVLEILSFYSAELATLVENGMVVLAADGNYYYSRDIDPETGDAYSGTVPLAAMQDIKDQAEALGEVATFDQWVNGYTDSDGVYHVGNSNSGYEDPAITQQAYDDYRENTLLTRDADAEETTALNQALRFLGIEDETAYQDIQGNYQDIISDPSQYGVTEEQKQMQDMARQREAAQMQVKAQDLVDRVMSQSGGSATRSLSAADAAINQISDYVLQQGMEDATSNLAAEMSRVSSAIQGQSSLGNMVSENAQTNLDRIDQQYLDIADNYLQSVNSVISSNAGALDQYNTQIKYATEQAYNSVMIQMGIEQDKISNAWTQIEAEKQTIMDQMNIALAQWGIMVDTNTMDLAWDMFADSQEFKTEDALALIIDGVSAAADIIPVL